MAALKRDAAKRADGRWTAPADREGRRGGGSWRSKAAQPRAAGSRAAAGDDRQDEQPAPSACEREGNSADGHAAECEEAEHQRESTEAARKDGAGEVELGVKQEGAGDDGEESGVRRRDPVGGGDAQGTFWPRDCSACRMPSAAESLAVDPEGVLDVNDGSRDVALLEVEARKDEPGGGAGLRA